MHRSYEWTSSGYPVKIKALMDFDLSQIPENAYVISAKLYLNGTGGHVTNLTTGSSTYKSNTSFLRRVISSWHEDTVTWETMPSVTTVNQDTLLNSTTTDQDYVADVTSIIQDMLIYPDYSFGMMLQLETETPFTEMRFASDSYTDETTMRPELVVEYQPITAFYEIGNADIVTGTTNYNYSNPFSTSKDDSRGQFLYRASELEASGMVAGDIYSLAFDVAEADNPFIESMNVKIGQTTATVLGSSYLTGLTTIHTNSYVPQNGWNTLEFSSPFAWDGTSNIVVEVCYHNTYPYNYNNHKIRLSNTSFNSVRGEASSSGASGCSMTTGNLRTTRPQIRFKADRRSIPYNANTEVTSYSSLPTNSKNYVRSAIALVGSGSSASTILGSALDPREVNEAVEYFDGLGRPIQSVAVCSTPSGLDLVKPITYDDYGRQVYDFLPYPAARISLKNAGFRDEDWESAGNDQEEFYQAHFDLVNNPYAYAESILEESPLNRLLAQGAPGSDWQPTGTDGLSGHTVRYEYATNTSTSNEDVRLWTVDGSSCTSTAFYAAGELYKSIVYSEDYDPTSNQDAYTVEYKDKQERVVLKEAFLSSESFPLRTYYIYDDFGLLRYVFPPEFSDTFKSSSVTESYSRSTSGIQDYCYYYDYDARRRMIEKELPGAEPVYMVYDNRDRLVLTQDGKLRDDEGSAYYLFTLYDQLNRPVVTGQCNHGSNTLSQTRIAIQSDATYYVERDNTVDGYDLSDGLPSGFIVTDYYTYTYYDDYSFRSVVSGCSNLIFSSSHEIADYDDNDGVSNGYFDRVNGKITGTRSLVLDDTGNNWISSIIYYDDRYRPIQVHSSLYPSGTSIISNEFDFAGNIDRTKETQVLGSETTELITKYSYDHAGRLLETWVSLDQAEEVLLAQNKYNELGELNEKNLHSEAGETVLQSVDYLYNIRGWLTNINDIGNYEESDYFAMELKYNESDTDLSNSSLYNGNISASKWWTAGSTDIMAYEYSYDEINRIDSADYTESVDGSWSPELYYETSYTYDRNGNINTLSRRNSLGVEIDNLSYDYTGNKIDKVTDSGTDDGFLDGFDSMSINDYEYDDNGNMEVDLNKNLRIDYNFLNLPEKVYEDETSPGSITYIYDASGVKWLKEVSNGSLTNTAYCGSFVYKKVGVSGTYELDYILNAEGRIDFDGSEPVFNYTLKDHLGNTRVEFDEDGTTNQKVNYYPFGMSHNSVLGGDNKYLYNGKELQDEQLGGVNLDWYDYNLRFYDPALGRWHVQDPRAEKYYGLSPYNYCANNPILLIDPQGDTINVSDALMNNQMAYGAFNAWYNSKVGKQFQGLFGVGGEFENVSVNIGIESENDGADGGTKMFGVNEKGEKRSLMKLGSGLEDGEYLRFDVNISSGFMVKEGTPTYNENLEYVRHTKKSATRSNYLGTINRSATLLHEAQHVEMMNNDMNADNSFDVGPYYQHQIMKDPKYRFYHQRKNFYQRLNIYNRPYNPNGFDD